LNSGDWWIIAFLAPMFAGGIIDMLVGAHALAKSSIAKGFLTALVICAAAAFGLKAISNALGLNYGLVAVAAFVVMFVVYAIARVRRKSVRTSEEKQT
jgi:peptidoglycan/LPS O-acetylase OafA/YrhL